MGLRLARAPAIAMWLLLALPLAGLALGTGPRELASALALPSTQQALWLSIRTTTAALTGIVLLGTPLAWWLSRASGRAAEAALLAVELPVVLPPAVLGVALLETFGRRGLLGPALELIGVSLPFSTGAVVLAQGMVGAPLFVLTAAAALRGVDDDLILVARTLGASPLRAFFSVAVPAAAPGLLSAAALAWARALGEFGATLMFAGSLPGRTQTLALAVYAALERDLAEARAVSVLLALVALGLIVGLRLLGGRVG